ncbi:hypothetical protein [Streptomyces phaeochromogenes]|uniref:hypothetical protein n=1 Tax=Streptomyces phaeochromogenes TaxID=1923 RepID=UPI00369AFB6B
MAILARPAKREDDLHGEPSRPPAQTLALFPITSWQARRLAKTTGMDHDTAWQEIRTATHPEEAVYVQRKRSSGA